MRKNRELVVLIKNLGEIYEEMEGIKKSSKKATRSFIKALRLSLWKCIGYYEAEKKAPVKDIFLLNYLTGMIRGIALAIHILKKKKGCLNSFAIFS